jgi:osmotically-inducible protein OsmY
MTPTAVQKSKAGLPDSESGAIKLSVDTANGVVTMSGILPTEREKSKAEQFARNTEDVKQAVNKLLTAKGSK